MKCQEARGLLTSHLNDEVTRSERELLQAHLAECESCWGELNKLSTAQHHLRSSMAEYAALAQPDDNAWPTLQRALHSQRPPARVQWSGRGIASSLSTLIVTISTALFVFSRLVVPAAPIPLSNPVVLPPAQTVAAVNTPPLVVNARQTGVLANDSPASQNSFQFTVETESELELETEKVARRNIRNDTLSNPTTLSNPSDKRDTAHSARWPLRVAIYAEDEGIERLSMVHQSNVSLKTGNTSLLLCRTCQRME